jgi:type III secretory pathway lipoprotein EscJ
MKEMKSKILLFCLFATLTLSSCKKTEYTNAIPSDAAAVMTIDMKALAQKSGINDQENATLKQHLTDAL